MTAIPTTTDDSFTPDQFIITSERNGKRTVITATAPDGTRVVRFTTKRQRYLAVRLVYVENKWDAKIRDFVPVNAWDINIIRGTDDPDVAVRVHRHTRSSVVLDTTTGVTSW